MTMPARKWRDYMVQRLKEHPEEIPGYLDACLEEDDRTFLTGLKTVVEARYGGAQGLARATGLHRVSIQNMLTVKGNPRLHNLETILKALGLRLSVSGQADAEPPRKRQQTKGGSSSAQRLASG
jgi:probable addiction module antidote protein